MNCGRLFKIYSIYEKKIKCPICEAEGTNPYYVKQEKISPKKMFGKFDK